MMAAKPLTTADVAALLFALRVLREKRGAA